MGNAAKVCALCGADCAGRPRVKDAKGRYYCRTCYDQAREKKLPVEAGRSSARTTPPAEPAGLGPPDVMHDLLAAEEQGQPLAEQTTCPECGSSIGGGVICMSCGYDMRTGKKLSMKVADKPSTGAASVATSVSSKGIALFAGLLGKSSPLIFGVIGGAVGAVIWAAIAYSIGREFSVIALLVGGLAGLGVAMGGGYGQTAGMLAAAIAIAAICVGKVGAMYFLVDSMSQKLVAKAVSQQDYVEHKGMAADFAKVKDRSEYPQFMIDHGLGGADRVEDLTPDDVATFESETCKELRKFQDEQPSYEQWRAQMQTSLKRHIHARMSFGNLLVNSLSILDGFFFLFAIGAAYRIPAGSS